MENIFNKNDIINICKKAKESSKALSQLSGEDKQNVLKLMIEKLQKAKNDIFTVNRIDIDEADKSGLAYPFIKRLTITENVFQNMIDHIKKIILLNDPVGRILEKYINSNGLRVEKVSIPIGVIGLIYESRPNVTSDSSAICLKSGNALILRGGSECIRTNTIIADAIRDALKESNISMDTIQIIRTIDHRAVDQLLKMDKYIDLLIPRGGKDLIKKISEGTKIPTLKHYEGICHYYVSKNAPVDMAVSVVVNSKCQSFEVCNALEKLLIDEKCASYMLKTFYKVFNEQNVELRGCEKTRKIIPEIKQAADEDWSTEYLAPILTVKIVKDIDEAVSHINSYGSHHTDGIISQDTDEIKKFTKEVDSASVMVNASTRLSGGGEYGLGAAIGISTDRMHARGPVGPNDLTTYKWIAYGNGHIR
ncbi:MAG: glutamate-5-semialdehyde dehydrogenase [Spirochaetes bacterium]|nr:glutamate-5-semialdehyde dehydrogenase [Spirochaetota bacterium]